MRRPVKPKHFLAPVLSRPEAPWALQSAQTGRVLATRIEMALDSRNRRRGLLGRDRLEPDSVMIIAPCNGVHTFFMRFAIDVVFVDRGGTVLKVFHGLRPWRIGVSLRAFAALELAAGGAANPAIAPGDRLEVVAEPGRAGQGPGGKAIP
jgi:uncharacterized protein